MHHAPSLTITQSIAPPDLWHWSITMPSGHCFCISNSFGTFEEAAMDAALFGGPTMSLAIKHMEEIG